MKCLVLAYQARAIMQRIGGNVAHVHLEPGARVSYGPYREVSRTFVSLLRSFPAVSAIEKASIDEAYLLCMPVAGSSSVLPMEQAVRVAQAIKQAGMHTFVSLQMTMGPEYCNLYPHTEQLNLSLQQDIMSYCAMLMRADDQQCVR